MVGCGVQFLEWAHVGCLSKMNGEAWRNSEPGWAGVVAGQVQGRLDGWPDRVEKDCYGGCREGLPYILDIVFVRQRCTCEEDDRSKCEARGIGVF